MYVLLEVHFLKFEVIIEKCIFVTFHMFVMLFGIILWRPLAITDEDTLIECIDLNIEDLEISLVVPSKFLWHLTIS